MQESALSHDVEGVGLAEGVGEERIRVNFGQDTGAVLSMPLCVQSINDLGDGDVGDRVVR